MSTQTQDVGWHRLPAHLLAVRGKDRIDLLQRLSSGDVRPLQQVGQVAQTLFCTNQGKLVDWCRLISLAEEVWIETSPARAPVLQQWLERYIVMEDVTVCDLSDSYARFIVSGAAASAALGLPPPQSHACVSVDDGPPGHPQALWYADLAAYGPRLSGLVAQQAAPGVEQLLAEAGCQPLSLHELEVARLRAGVPGAAAEYRDQVHPSELRLTAHAISWNKGCYIGQEVISRLENFDKVARLLIGFETAEQIPAGEDLRLFNSAGAPLGRVTSLAITAPGTLGLAVVKRAFAQAGEAGLTTAGKTFPVRLVERPFFSLT